MSTKSNNIGAVVAEVFKVNQDAPKVTVTLKPDRNGMQRWAEAKGLSIPTLEQAAVAVRTCSMANQSEELQASITRLALHYAVGINGLRIHPEVRSSADQKARRAATKLLGTRIKEACGGVGVKGSAATYLSTVARWLGYFKDRTPEIMDQDGKPVAYFPVSAMVSEINSAKNPTTKDHLKLVLDNVAEMVNGFEQVQAALDARREAVALAAIESAAFTSK